jgi:hypothetical protein
MHWRTVDLELLEKTGNLARSTTVATQTEEKSCLKRRKRKILVMRLKKAIGCPPFQDLRFL